MRGQSTAWSPAARLLPPCGECCCAVAVGGWPLGRPGQAPGQPDSWAGRLQSKKESDVLPATHLVCSPPSPSRRVDNAELRQALQAEAAVLALLAKLDAAQVGWAVASCEAEGWLGRLLSWPKPCRRPHTPTAQPTQCLPPPPPLQVSFVGEAEGASLSGQKGQIELVVGEGVEVFLPMAGLFDAGAPGGVLRWNQLVLCT